MKAPLQLELKEKRSNASVTTSNESKCILMAVPETKDELIHAMNTNFALLMKKLVDISPPLAFKPIMEGHAKDSIISVAQLISYLVGWGDLVLSWHDKEAKGKAIAFPEQGYKWNELGRLAQKFYTDYEAIRDYNALLERLSENKQMLIALVEQFDNEALYGHPWYRQWTRGRMIQFNTASPYKNASVRLNQLKRQNPEYFQ